MPYLIRLIRGLVVVAALAGAPLALATAPAWAAGSADVTVSLSSVPTTPTAGRPVSYKVVVHNRGPVSAEKVQIDFRTSAPLSSPSWRISTGRCMRSPAETACLFGTLRTGASASATISGIMPKDLAPGTRVTNQVTLASDTTLTDPAHSVAHADYTIPGGSTAPSPVASAPATAPSTAPAAGVTANALPVIESDPPGGRFRPLWIAVAVVGAVVAIVSLALAMRLRARARPDRHAAPY